MRFPHDETGKQQKLTYPWHGPYRVVEKRDRELTVVPVYFPQKGQIQVHQSRLTPCLNNLPAGFYWDDGQHVGPGRPPQWVRKLFQDQEDHTQNATALEDADLEPGKRDEDSEETRYGPEPVPDHSNTHYRRGSRTNFRVVPCSTK